MQTGVKENWCQRELEGQRRRNMFLGQLRNKNNCICLGFNHSEVSGFIEQIGADR
jgi:hypothetical protein